MVFGKQCTKPIGHLLLTTSVVVCVSFGQTTRPRVFLFDSDVLVRVRTAIRSHDSAYTSAFQKLCREADKALKQAPVSVVDKTKNPPSNDKHDYVSLAPYWWPDPEKADGRPYVRRDGEVNPERELYTDRANLRTMTSMVATLSLAYYFSGNEQYARHATRFLRLWFLEPETRMNPNLNFAQGVKGRNEGRGAGVLDGSSFRFVVDAIGLLSGSTSWTVGDQDGMREWFERYFEWLRSSENGKSEAAAKNNHGTWYDVQTVSIAFFLGKDSNARTILDESKTKRIATQIEPDGRMPLELTRTKAFGYTTMNIDAFISLASLGGRAGIDLWSFETDDGRSIRKAIDWVLPFWVKEKAWSYPQIIPFNHEEGYPLLVQAWHRFKDPKYLEAAGRIKGSNPITDRSRLLYGVTE